MLYRLAVVVLSSLLLAQNICADVSPNQVVVTIQAVTTVSQTLNTALVTVDKSTTVSQLSSVALTITNGFSQIVSSVTNAVTMIGSSAPFNSDGATLVVNTLLTFIQIHQALLSTVIGKHTFFAQFGLTAPFLVVLRALEAGVDGFATALLTLIPTQTTQAQGGFKSLDDSVNNCIDMYSQLCIPSIIYPATGPLCVSF